MQKGDSMKRKQVAAGLAMAVAASLAAAADQDASEPVEVSADVSVLSAYVARGQVADDRAVAQPMLEVSKNGFLVNIWGDYGLTDRTTEDPDFYELDLTVGYRREFGRCAVEGGLIEYVFPNTLKPVADPEAGTPGVPPGLESDSTREAYLIVGATEDSALQPWVSAFYDLDAADGLYVNLGVEYEIALGEKLALTPGFLAGWGNAKNNDYNFGVNDAAMNDGNVYASLAYAWSESLETSASVNYMWLWDSDIRDAAASYYWDDTSVWGGLTASYTF